VGDVSPAGFEALRLSIWGAHRLFDRRAALCVGVNTIGLAEAKARTGPVPDRTVWRRIERRVPEVLRDFLDAGMSEGTGWKLIPLVLEPGIRELALDNDLILWELPDALRRWIDQPGRPLFAADVTPAHGRFAPQCGPMPGNSGMRGIPAGFDYAEAIRAVLAENPARLQSELDEQGLQVAALSRGADPLIVPTQDVAICSPFPPHTSELGRCGAHFVGLNSKSIPWRYYGRPAHQVRLEHWHSRRQEVYRRLGLDPPPTAVLQPEAAGAC
jgi:hypothetical protein